MPTNNPSAGNNHSQKFMATEIMMIEKTVLMPNFQPTMNPATNNNTALM